MTDTHVIDARAQMKALLARTDIRYVVWRRRPDLPDEQMPRGWEGRWELMREVTMSVRLRPSSTPYSAATAIPTDRYEVREDGEVARVYELHW